MAPLICRRLPRCIKRGYSLAASTTSFYVSLHHHTPAIGMQAAVLRGLLHSVSVSLLRRPIPKMPHLFFSRPARVVDQDSVSISSSPSSSSSLSLSSSSSSSSSWTLSQNIRRESRSPRPAYEDSLRQPKIDQRVTPFTDFPVLGMTFHFCMNGLSFVGRLVLTN